jgi:hypothetical protein
MPTDRPHPLAELYSRTHKARMLRALIDRPEGYTSLELATKLFGGDDAAAQHMLWETATKLRRDLPAGWSIPSAQFKTYRLVNEEEAANAA